LCVYSPFAVAMNVIGTSRQLTRWADGSHRYSLRVAMLPFTDTDSVESSEQIVVLYRITYDG